MSIEVKNIINIYHYRHTRVTENIYVTESAQDCIIDQSLINVVCAQWMECSIMNIVVLLHFFHNVHAR